MTSVIHESFWLGRVSKAYLIGQNISMFNVNRNSFFSTREWLRRLFDNWILFLCMLARLQQNFTCMQ